MNLLGITAENISAILNKYVASDGTVTESGLVSFTKYGDLVDVNLPEPKYIEEKKNARAINKFRSAALYSGKDLYPYPD
jgi:hypothetical protein